MANNYQKFSETIKYLTEEEIVWWERYALDKYCDYCYKSSASEDGDTCLSCEYGAITDIGFGIEIHENEVWIYGEEYGDIYAVENAVQSFLKAHRPNSYFTLTWSNTCSKLRPGEFGGGALVVTAKESYDQSSWEFILKMERKLSLKISDKL